jgi:TadE-like protein
VSSFLRSNGDSLRVSERGTALIEFTLVASLLFTLLFGIIEFGLAFRDRLTISNASQGAARVGSSLGDNDDADYEMLRSLEQSLGTLANSGVDIVRYVDVFAANSAGNPISGCPGSKCNRYLYSPGFKPGCDWNPCPNPAIGYSGWSWAPSARDVELPGLDVMGVRITFKHDWVTGGLIPLPKIQCDGTPGSKCWTDGALMRLEPQVFAP